SRGRAHRLHGRVPHLGGVHRAGLRRRAARAHPRDEEVDARDQLIRWWTATGNGGMPGGVPPFAIFTAPCYLDRPPPRRPHVTQTPRRPPLPVPHRDVGTVRVLPHDRHLPALPDGPH